MKYNMMNNLKFIEATNERHPRPARPASIPLSRLTVSASIEPPGAASISADTVSAGSATDFASRVSGMEAGTVSPTLSAAKENKNEIQYDE
jgi:hypothetical protein